MTTNPALRSTLLAFRAMVRARGPRECLEVACAIPAPLMRAETMDDYVIRFGVPFLAARAALRWWRWAERDGKVLVCRNLGRLPMLPYDFDADT